MLTPSTVGLADRVIEGQHELAAMRTSAGLRSSAAALADRVDQLGCRDLYSASSSAEGVVAVAVALDEGLRAITLRQIAEERIDKVIVVETVAVSGMTVRRAAEAVREAGAHWVGAVVLKDLDASHGRDDGRRFGAVDEIRFAG